MTKIKETNFIKFLGTAGARFVVTTQLRASGGIWVSLDHVNILIDPGPGSLVRILNSKPKLDPKELDAIFVSHKHIDHSNDTSIMIEAMTEGGKRKKGLLFIPQDMLNEGGGIYPHSLNYLSQPPVIIKENLNYKIKDVSIKIPLKHMHPAETYGCIISDQDISIGYIADTEFFSSLSEKYQCNIIIVNVVLIEEDIFIMTHLGMRMLHSKPWEIAENLSKQMNKKIITATDGFTLPLKK